MRYHEFCQYVSCIAYEKEGRRHTINHVKDGEEDITPDGKTVEQRYGECGVECDGTRGIESGENCTKVIPVILDNI